MLKIDWDPDKHTTLGEQAMFGLSLIARAFCMVAVINIFYAAVFVPGLFGCAAPSPTGGSSQCIALIPITVLGIATAYFTAYGSNWTPVSRKYESIDAGVSLVLSGLLGYGIYRNWWSADWTETMTFAMWLFGTLVAFSIVLDWFARLKRWSWLRKQANPTPTPTT